MDCVVVGRVEPERAEVGFGPPRTVDLEDGGTATIYCDASQVTVSLKGIPPTPTPGDALIIAEKAATKTISAMGFAMGKGYRVKMIQVIDSSGHPYVFGVYHRYLDFGDANHLSVMDRALKLSSSDRRFGYALKDYVRAMNETKECGAYCYRAVEAICSSFGTGRNKVADWKKMHAALGTNKDDIQETIQNFADPIRHGNWIKMETPSLQQLDDMRILTREILVKYIDYKRNSNF